MNDKDKRTQSRLNIAVGLVVIIIGIVGQVTGGMAWWLIASCMILGAIVLLKRRS